MTRMYLGLFFSFFLFSELNAQVNLVIHNETGFDVDSLVIGNQLVGDIEKGDISDSTEYVEIEIYTNGYLKGTIPISGTIRQRSQRMTYSILGRASVQSQILKSGTYHFKLEISGNLYSQWDSLFLSPLN